MAEPDIEPLLRELKTTGLCVCPATTIWPDYAAIRPALHDKAQAFLTDCVVTPQRFASKWKPFLCVSTKWEPPYASTHPLVQLHPALQRIANAFLGWQSWWYAAAYWVTFPSQGPRVYSQAWHRDNEAERTLKVFLHLQEVAPAHGPFEYLLGSPETDYELCGPRRYMKQARWADVPADRIYTGTVPADTVILANTAGLHRGGNTEAGYRLQATWGFLPGKPAGARPWFGLQ